MNPRSGQVFLKMHDIAQRLPSLRPGQILALVMQVDGSKYQTESWAWTAWLDDAVANLEANK